MKQTVLITGAARRIGRSIALDLAKKKYNIALHYYSSMQEAKTLACELKNQSVNVKLYQADLSQEKEISGLIRKVNQDFENFNLLINNASVFIRSNLKNTTNDIFNLTMNINFKAPYILSRDFALICQKGQIINILDTKISKNNSLYSAYSLSKQALYHFTLQAAKELSPAIRVNGISPGVILPPAKKDDDYLDQLIKNIPLKKIGSPALILETISFLLKNDYITGQIIYLDGGQHL